MNEEHQRIIIKRIYGYDQQEGAAQGHASSAPINRWVLLAMMIPVLALMAVLGIFFFTIFVALFSIIAVVIGTRIWWLRKKARHHVQQTQSTQTDRSTEVEDAEIIEDIHTTRKNNHSGNRE